MGKGLVVRVALLVAMCAVWGAAVQAEGITATAVPSSSWVRVGRQVTVAVRIDSPVKVGSYSAALSWNPALFEFVSYASPAGGFMTMVNATNVAAGQIRFAGANVYGALGRIELMVVVLRAKAPGVGVLDLSVPAIAEAGTLKSLAGMLKVNDGKVRILW